MNKLLIALSFLCVLSNTRAQSLETAQSKKFNAFSLETGFGATIPLSPKDNISRTKFTGLSQFNIGGRYMFTKSLGIKGSYQFDGFRSKEMSNVVGIDYHTLRLEGVYNVGRLLNLPQRVYENFGLLTHAGVGYSRGKPVGENFSEQTANLQWGLTPLFKLNNTIALYGDLTYVFNFKQHYAYDGSLLNPTFDSVTGRYITMGIGVMIYIGEENRHADWY